MKRKLLAFILALVVIFSIIGAWYYTSYPTISVGKLVSSNSDNFKEEFHRLVNIIDKVSKIEICRCL